MLHLTGMIATVGLACVVGFSGLSSGIPSAATGYLPSSFSTATYYSSPSSEAGFLHLVALPDEDPSGVPGTFTCGDDSFQPLFKNTGTTDKILTITPDAGTDRLFFVKVWDKDGNL